MRKIKSLSPKLLRTFKNTQIKRRIANAPVKSVMVGMLTGIGTGIAISYLAHHRK